MPHTESTRQHSRLLFQRDGFALGQFRWDASRAGMRRDSCIGSFALIAIPWTAVRINCQGRRPVIADSCTGIFYNPNQSYVAEQLLEGVPERTIYIVPDEQTLRDCVTEIDGRPSDDPARMLRFESGPIDAKTFIELRQLVEWLDRDTVAANDDSLAIHEIAMRIAARLIARSYRARGEGVSARKLQSVNERAVSRHREIAQRVREVCLTHFHERLSLQEIAEAVDASRFHVCRLFRLMTGRSIHQYLTDLRLRASLDGVCDRCAPLARVALDSGFSNQSHFTTAFARRFGRTPAAFRREVARGNVYPLTI
ncbi:hypothetical protein BH09PLA1_BH09PLA1_05990 [soil metagenome]